ncbi:MAG: hypothetical protein HY512_03600 [Candidatus Aenigmarchaeota archaeon]|nr:hypothetical protein [Candidatus Aenigmarchaeota archaeon]
MRSKIAVNPGSYNHGVIKLIRAQSPERDRLVNAIRKMPAGDTREFLEANTDFFYKMTSGLSAGNGKLLHEVMIGIRGQRDDSEPSIGVIMPIVGRNLIGCSDDYYHNFLRSVGSASSTTVHPTHTMAALDMITAKRFFPYRKIGALIFDRHDDLQVPEDEFTVDFRDGACKASVLNYCLSKDILDSAVVVGVPPYFGINGNAERVLHGSKIPDVRERVMFLGEADYEIQRKNSVHFPHMTLAETYVPQRRIPLEGAARKAAEFLAQRGVQHVIVQNDVDSLEHSFTGSSYSLYSYFLMSVLSTDPDVLPDCFPLSYLTLGHGLSPEEQLGFVRTFLDEINGRGLQIGVPIRGGRYNGGVYELESHLDMGLRTSRAAYAFCKELNRLSAELNE